MRRETKFGVVIGTKRSRTSQGQRQVSGLRHEWYRQPNPVSQSDYALRRSYPWLARPWRPSTSNRHSSRVEHDPTRRKQSAAALSTRHTRETPFFQPMVMEALAYREEMVFITAARRSFFEAWRPVFDTSLCFDLLLAFLGCDSYLRCHNGTPWNTNGFRRSSRGSVDPTERKTRAHCPANKRFAEAPAPSFGRRIFCGGLPVQHQATLKRIASRLRG